MKDYEEKGFTKNMVKIESLQGRPRVYVNALEQDSQKEQTPYAPPTLISKGTVQTTGGGVTELLSQTGGTVLFTVDPETGTVTIAGPIQASVTLNVGTINNTVIAGQGTIAGTVTNNRLIQNGTWNNGTFTTPAISGGTHDSFVAGTPTITGGNWSIGTLGTPAITGGNITNGTLSTPTVTGGSWTTGTFAGTPAMITLVDLSAMGTGNPTIKITATSSTPTVVFAGGTFGPTTAPEGFMKINVGGSSRYIPYWI